MAYGAENGVTPETRATAPRRPPLTRETIAQAARDILVSEGLDAVSLRRVAGRLDVTAPALYGHFIDKRDLLQAIAEEEIREIASEFGDVHSSDPLDRIRRQCHAYIDYACRNPDLFRTMFLHRPELTAQPRGDQPPLALVLTDRIVASMRDAFDAENFAGQDPELAAMTLWTAVHGVATMLLAGPPLHLDQRSRLGDSVIDSILSGLRHGSPVSTS